LLPRDRTLVLYCYGKHCGLSTRQGKRLLELGYDKLMVLDYGWMAWTKAGYPTVRRGRVEAE
jgi:rhodanese-related sulfurtransferase